MNCATGLFAQRLGLPGAVASNEIELIALTLADLAKRADGSPIRMSAEALRAVIDGLTCARDKVRELEADLADAQDRLEIIPRLKGLLELYEDEPIKEIPGDLPC